MNAEGQSRVSIERDVVAPLLTFVLVYFGALAALLYFVPRSSIAGFHASGLAAAVVATFATKLAFRDARLVVHRPRASGVMLGSLVGLAIILVTDVVLILARRVEHSWVGAFPVAVVLLLFVPAAIHEELVFRGEVFQRVALWRPAVAIVSTSMLFALAHGANSGISSVALLNIVMAGVLLGIVRSAWGLGAAIALHIVWNLTSGVVLGHEVSGQLLDRTLFSSRDHGPELATGGAFGLEGSVVMSAVLALSTWAVWRRDRRNQRRAVSVMPSGIIAVPPGSGADSPEKTITEKQ